MRIALRQTRNEPKSLPFWVWPLYLLLLWQILLSAQNPGLMSDDSGEMIAASCRLGLPHPPGYPLFNLVGYLFSFIHVGSVAFGFNLLGTLLVLFSLALILDTCRQLKIFSSSQGYFMECLLMLLGVLFVANRSVFAQCLTAKGCVYGFTLLFVSLLLWLRVKWVSSWSIFLLTWFLWSVGMANHWQTQVFWLPFLFFWGVKTKIIRTLKVALYASSLGVMGLSLYLYLPLRAVLGVLPCWGNPITLRGFYWVVSRQLVKRSENWIQPFSFYVQSVQWIFKTLMFYWMPGFIFLALIGVAALWKRNHFFLNNLLLLFLPVLIGVALVHEERNQYLVPVYLVSLAGMMVILGFAGLNWLQERLGKESKLHWAFLLMAAVLSASWLVNVYHLENKSRYTLAEDFGLNVLKGLPKNALLIADGDHYVMPIWYLQYAKGLRPDLIFQPSVFLYHNWGWAQLAEHSADIKKAIYSTPLFAGRLTALTALFPQQPFYYSLERDYLQPVLDQVPGEWIPSGLAYEWREKTPAARDVFNRSALLINTERLRGLEEFPDFKRIDPSTTQIYRYYALQDSLLAQFLKKLSATSPETPK